MAFWGCSFIFNEVPCEDFDLMMYEVSGASPSAGKFASGVTVVEQKLANRWKPLFYGTKLEEKLEFEIAFGVNQKRIDKNAYLDRYELEAIASWLTGHEQYCWLEIIQPDMEYFRYRCVITDLQVVEFGLVPMALKATVTCDGPYAYLYPQTFEYAIDGETTIEFFNESSHNGYYYPILEYVPADAGTLTIVNKTDGDRTFELADHVVATCIRVDNDLGIVSAYQGNTYFPNSTLSGPSGVEVGVASRDGSYAIELGRLYSMSVYETPADPEGSSVELETAELYSYSNSDGYPEISLSNVRVYSKGSNGVYVVNSNDYDVTVKVQALDNDVRIDIDMYPYFNFKFLRLLKGQNTLVVSGNGTLRLLCEFPINTGG